MGLTQNTRTFSWGSHRHPSVMFGLAQIPNTFQLGSHRRPLSMGLSNSRTYLGLSLGNSEGTQIINGLTQAPQPNINRLPLNIRVAQILPFYLRAETNTPPLRNGPKRIPNNGFYGLAKKRISRKQLVSPRHQTYYRGSKRYPTNCSLMTSDKESPLRFHFTPGENKLATIWKTVVRLDERKIHTPTEVHKKKPISHIGVRAISFACAAIFRTRSRAENAAAVNQSSRCADSARVFRL